MFFFEHNLRSFIKMVEERKASDFFKAVVPRKPKVTNNTCEDLVVTPELLMTQFSTNYMECSALQKRGVKRHMESTEKKMEKELLQARQTLTTLLASLSVKETELRNALEGTGLSTLPSTLLGVPTQELDFKERMTFFARTLINNTNAPRGTKVKTTAIRRLLNDYCEVNKKVVSQEAKIQKMSSSLALLGSNSLVTANLTDTVLHNSPMFNVSEVLSQTEYVPLVFDHNDVYYHFTRLEDVLQFHHNLFDKCVADKCVPPWKTFWSLMDCPKFTVEQLSRGCYIGLMLITNMSDMSNGNEVVNLDNMCVSVSEQIRGLDLQRGKKYVTWYLGQYSKDSVIEDHRLWVKMVDGLFESVQHAPGCWNTEFQQGWSSHLVRGQPYKPMYVNILPGIKEVKPDTWGTTDTLDWIVRNVHFWAHQLNTYAPHGYNLVCNHNFHRSLFTETPRLMRFPVLWRYKMVLQDLTSNVSDKRLLVTLRLEKCMTLCRHMKREFQNCEFSLVYHQWRKVMQLLEETEGLAVECSKEMNSLNVIVQSLLMEHNYVKEKLCQARALLQLEGLLVDESINKYEQDMQELLQKSQLLLKPLHGDGFVEVSPSSKNNGDGENALCVVDSPSPNVWNSTTVTLELMKELSAVVDHLKTGYKESVDTMCTEVLIQPGTLFESFDEVKKRVKASRNDLHPDSRLNLTGDHDPTLVEYYKYHSWALLLEAVEKLNRLFFSKVR